MKASHLWIICDKEDQGPSYAFIMNFYLTKKEAQKDIDSLCNGSWVWNKKNYEIRKYILEEK